MAKHTSILLDDHYEAFVREQVESGSYATVSEVVRDALRRLEQKKRRDEVVLKAIEEGLASGVSPLSHQEVWARVRERHAQRAQKP